MFTIKPVLLKGQNIQLEILDTKHRDDLYQAAQDEIISQYMPNKIQGDKFYRWFDAALNKKTEQQLPFVVRRQTDGKIIGSSRYYDIQAEHHRLAIGYTWYIPEVWGTVVNPECKYLLLQHAFEKLSANRVEFIIDARNTRSRAAVKKLGAIEEGLLRQHVILENGFIRDSVVFSIIQSEWSVVKTSLEQRLATHL